jgi:UV DNA damage endonuclease
LPVVFDVFHDQLAPSFAGECVRELVLRAGETWECEDVRQEVHCSTQAPGKRPGAHAETVDVGAFARFVEEVGDDLRLDCILEVKDKECSVLRVRELVRAKPAPVAAEMSGSTATILTHLVVPRRTTGGLRPVS